MKILHTVQLYHPAVGGSEEVVKQLSERLAKRGHDITVATSWHKDRQQKIINNVKIKEFKVKGNEIYGIEGETERYKKLLMNGDFDIILNYGIQIWSTDLAFAVLQKIRSKKILIPLAFPGLGSKEYSNYYQKMPDILNNYDKVICLAKRAQDKIFCDQREFKKSIVIPNGADEREFLKPSSNFCQKFKIKTPYFLLSVSNHFLLKGHNFIIEAFKKIGRKDVTLVIIGRKPAKFSRFDIGGCYYFCKIESLFQKNLKILDNISRENTVAAFKEADIFIFSSKFECAVPLVILEAMAAKKTFISTQYGTIEDMADYGAIVTTPDEMATKINEFLDQPKLREKLGADAFKNWQQHYTWEAITDQYEKLYKDLLKS